MNDVTQPNYILGHSPHEIRRLILQADLLRPTTERLLKTAGVGSGMRVLDLGCGAGDVSILTAELIGPSGYVVGIDRSPEVIALACKRAATTGLRNVTFKNVALDEFCEPEPFDCIVGRYILIHQADPVNFLRQAARFLRPRGVVAFHELSFSESRGSWPSVDSWDTMLTLTRATFRKALPHHDVADRLIALFSQVGLPCPALFSELPIGGGRDSPLYAWLAETVRTLLTRLPHSDVASDTLMPIDTLEGRLRDAVVTAHSQVAAPPQICAWTRL
jgi:ubiquinone/menaquinone biosynthesis C-methylase UbiE